MKRILVLAYAISPTRGSEYSVAWNYVTNMSKDNELIVLYGMSGNHMGDILELNLYIKDNPIQNVRFIAIHPNKIAQYLNIFNRNGIFVYTFYFAYNIWHRQAFTKAKELINQEHFDLIHYLGPIGYREPGYLWKINLPYIWGPIGGTTNVSCKLIKVLPLKGQLKLGFRALINTLQLHFNPRLKKAIQRADVLLSATTENQSIIKKVFSTDSIYIPENGIIVDCKKRNSIKITNNLVKLIWIGSIDERKALIILLKSLVKVNYLHLIQLHIVGDGPLKLELQNFAILNNIDPFIVWHNHIPRSMVIRLIADSHLNLVTSVSEGNPTTIWEAMSVGVPTISLDHCGMHDTICKKCGIKIKIESYNQVIIDLASTLDRLVKNHDEIENLSKGVYECAKQYNWLNRSYFFNNIYDLAIKNWINKNQYIYDKGNQ